MKIVIFNNKHKLDIQHDILYFSCLDNPQEVIGQIRAFRPDLIIEEEKNDERSRFWPIYNKFPNVPKAWWMIDAHTNLIDHLVYAKGFEYIFCAQSWFLPLVTREALGQIFYLPLCHTQTMTEYQNMMRTKVKKDIELSFVGNIRSIHIERRMYVKKLLQIYGDKFLALKTDYDKMLVYLRRSKVTFNCSLNNDLNFRVWEALACGAYPITDEVTDVNKIQGIKEYLTLYDKLYPNWQSLQVPLNKYSMENFIKDHTLTHRYLELIQMCETGKQKEYI